MRFLILALLVLGGCSDGQGGTSDGLGDGAGGPGPRDPPVRISREVSDTLSTPIPTPLVPNVPGATAPAEAGADRQPSGITEDDVAGVAGTLVSGIQLTVYSCLNDSTGSYCPDGPAMFSGQQVHRGAIACGWQWPIGQRLRIIGDPYVDTIYTCLDRGGAVTGIDAWFYDADDPATQAWRAAFIDVVTVELLD